MEVYHGPPLGPCRKWPIGGVTTGVLGSHSTYSRRADDAFVNQSGNCRGIAVRPPGPPARTGGNRPLFHHQQPVLTFPVPRRFEKQTARRTYGCGPGAARRSTGGPTSASVPLALHVAGDGGPRRVPGRPGRAAEGLPLGRPLARQSDGDGGPALHGRPRSARRRQPGSPARIPVPARRPETGPAVKGRNRPYKAIGAAPR